MSEHKVKTHTDFILPSSVVTRVDVSRLATEVERLDNELTAVAVRSKHGSEETTPPTVSEQLNSFLNQNKLTLDTGRERSDLVKELRLLKDKVPVLHMTFAVTADPESLQELTKWVRESVHPQAVIAVGLQPALVGGVYLRTPNHVHDLTLRGLFESSRGELTKELESLRGIS